MKKFEEIPDEAYQKEEIPSEVLEQWLEEDIALAKAREAASKKMEAILVRKPISLPK